MSLFHSTARQDRPALAFLRLAVFVLCAAAMGDAPAFTLYTVGNDAACSFSDLQQAIDAATDPEGNSILIAQDLAYDETHIRIIDKDINLLGGLAQCDSATYEGLTTLNGTSGHSVIEIEGVSHVYVANLWLTGASMDESHQGGGIYFGGQGTLELANTSISQNTTGYGAGVDMSPSGPSTLTIDSDTVITRNVALLSGGGVRVEGQTRLFIMQPHTLIGFNVAENGYGGGVQVIGPAQAEIGSPGYGGLGVIYSNTATYGGGLAIYDSENNDTAVARVFTTDPANPVKIEQNIATATGGGVYLRPHSNFGFSPNNRAILCAYDFLIDGNSAQDGAAIYGDVDVYGSVVALNTSPETLPGFGIYSCDSPEPPSALGAVHCAAGVACNRIEGNLSQREDGTSTDGATILIQSESALYADRFEMRHDIGGHAVRFVDDQSDSDARVEMRDCLIVDNTASGDLIDAGPDGSTSGGTSLVLSRCTLANNAIGTPYVMHVAANFFEISNAIVDQPGFDVVDYAGPAGDMNAHDVLANNVGTLVGGVNLVDGAPTYVDAGNGDYHLQRTSFGVDWTEPDGVVDLEGNPRTVDLIDVPNFEGFGTMDLGPYEIQTQLATCATSDTVYCDGFDGL